MIKLVRHKITGKKEVRFFLPEDQDYKILQRLLKESEEKELIQFSYDVRNGIERLCQLLYYGRI